jgi:predicted secreted protein
MALIRGKDVLFQALYGSDYVTVACGKSVTIRTETDIKEITTKGNGAYKDFDYRLLSYTINFDGVLMTHDLVTPTIFDFASYQKQFLEIDTRIIFYDTTAPTPIPKVFRGQQIVQNAMMGANPSQYADGSVQLLGKGEYFLEDFVPVPTNLRLIIVGFTGNENAKAKLRLLDDNGNVVWRSDDLQQSINGWLVNPIDITVVITAGHYYVEHDTQTETQNNLFIVDTVPSYTRQFPIGNSSFSSYPTDKLDFTVPREVEWSLGPVPPPPACINVVIPGSPTLPDGQTTLPYTASFGITGSPLYVLSNITKPSWMNIQLVESTPGNWIVQITGTPDATGTDIEVSFDITNCTAGLVHFSDTIDITTPSGGSSNVSWSYTESFANGTFRIYRNGIEVVMRTASDSGSFDIAAGDDMEVTIAPFATQTSNLVITDSVDGDLYNNSIADSQSFTWTAISGHDYTITCSVEP